ncbi:hypothetical protein PVAG01_02902 [Phlyctema vagabunda]|uniref:Uncharacterized protein n=1 Tax=Phlyctema vagabunda TaxID=108571 RepID=A0ABR4PT89_9HELO
MSVFSKIKMSRKAAKEHKGKEKAKEVIEEIIPKQPYKHVPTHAAVDALSGAPSSWKVEDRPKIKEQHQRRSQMRISRNSSYLSTVSYATQYGPASQHGPAPSDAGASSSQAPPAPAFARNNSYQSYNPGPAWFDRENNGDRDRRHPTDTQIQKRRKPTRGHSYHDSGLGTSVGPSPLASNVASEDASPVVSSGNSTTSNSSDNLEMATTQRPNRSSHRPQPVTYAEQDIFDRLHTSTTRKLGEAPLHDGPLPLSTLPVKVMAPVEPKQKKQRWSLRGKRNSATIAAM